MTGDRDPFPRKAGRSTRVKRSASRHRRHAMEVPREAQSRCLARAGPAPRIRQLRDRAHRTGPHETPAQRVSAAIAAAADQFDPASTENTPMSSGFAT
jgi:hypothetical protein